MDSTGALALADVPETLLVVGGGYIGLEMGTVYAELGSKVTVVELLDGLLPGADRDLVKPLEKRLRERFAGDSSEHEGRRAEGRRRQGRSRDRRPRRRNGTYPLRPRAGLGRPPAEVTSGIGLENTKVKVNDKGFVEVDEQQRTADPHILAIGDVAGEPMLAHKASHEGKVAAEVLAGEPAAFEPAGDSGGGVHRSGNRLGRPDRRPSEARRAARSRSLSTPGRPAAGRSPIGRTDGLTKWLVDPATDRVLGCGIVGAGAGELIAEAVVAIEMGCTVRDVAESIHPHPTLSETVAFAGEVHLGTATEVYRPKRKQKQES